MNEQVGSRVHPASTSRHEVAEFICLRSAGSNIRPRMHMRTAIVGVRAGSTVRVESKRTVVVEHECLLLVPPLHLYGVQSLGPSNQSITTLLVEMTELDDAAMNKLPALVSVPSLHDAWVELVAGNEVPTSATERALGMRALIKRWISDAAPLPPGHVTGWAAPLGPLRDYMRSHMNEAIPTTRLVEISGLTSSHCIRAFGQEFGLPPHAYHVQLRLASACEFLAQGGRVATVAHDCGFSDQSHLSRKFREAYDIAPGAWAVLVSETVLNTSGSSRVVARPRACQQVTSQPVPA